MAKEINDLKTFLTEFDSLLKVVEQCSPVLFRETFRKNLKKVLPKVSEQLEDCHGLAQIDSPGKYEKDLRKAGLSGQQLELKLESFTSSLKAFEEKGSVDDLQDALGKGGTLLKSLAGAIPGFGSFAQELVDFILKELKRRLGP